MKASLYYIPEGCICQGDGLMGMKCEAKDHAKLKTVLFDEDSRLCEIAEAVGLVVTRLDRIEVTDEAALAAVGLMRSIPDYTRIRRLLLDGVEVPGARMAGVEYVLRRK